MPTPLRHFLSRAPAPSSLRAMRGDGSAVAIAIQATRRRWSDAEAAIPDDATRVEALDSEGRVLRVHALDADVDDGRGASPSSGSSSSVGVPVTPMELARIVLEATDAGAKRHAAAYEATQAELVALVRVIADQHHAAQRRLAALESAWHKAITRPAAAEPDEESGVEAMLAPVIAAAFGGAAPPKKEKAG